MNRSWLLRTACALAFWSFASAASRAGEPSEWRVTLDVQIVAIAPERALKLVPSLRDAATFDSAFSEIQRMIEKDEADLVAWPRIITTAKSLFRGDQKADRNANGLPIAIPETDELANSETVIEASSPTEFLPPDEPQTFGSPGPLVRLFQIHRSETTTPTAFETRNLGVTFEAEARVSNNGDAVELSAHVERGSLLGYDTIRTMISPARVEAIFPMPQFQISKVHSRFTMPSGKRMLLGVFVEARPASRVLLFLMKAVATPAGDKSPHP